MTYGNLSNGTPATFRPLLNTRGRPIKFTLERLQQIRNLVERGTSREEIAKILDVTLGSLQVTCSKVGISLRQPKLDSGVRSARRRNPLPSKNAIIIHHHEGSVPSQPSDHPAAAAKPPQETVKERVRSAPRTSRSGCITKAWSGQLNCRSLWMRSRGDRLCSTRNGTSLRFITKAATSKCRAKNKPSSATRASLSIASSPACLALASNSEEHFRAI